MTSKDLRALLFAAILVAVTLATIALGQLISPPPTNAQIRQAGTIVRTRTEVVGGKVVTDSETIRDGRVIAHHES